MGQQQNIDSQQELESLMDPPHYEESSNTPQTEGSSTEQVQKVHVKFLLATKLKVTTYDMEFLMLPSTTLQEACNIANRKLERDLNFSNGSGVGKLVRRIGDWMDLEMSSQNHCNVVFVRRKVLAGDLSQTIGETVLENNCLYMSNSIDCFHVQYRFEATVVCLIILGFILFFLFLFLFFGGFLH